MAEPGMPDFATSIWFDLVMPSGTLRPIGDTLASAVDEGIKTTRVTESRQPPG
jgi:hypothetical protein